VSKKIADLCGEVTSAKVVELLIEALWSNDPRTAQLALKALLMKLCGAGCSSADPDGHPPPPN
jgi:hypothetical protein